MYQAASNGRRASLVVSGALMLWTLQAAAADFLQEIVVTAQKREQAIQDVPIAITAFSGEQLSELGFRESADVVTMTPGVGVSGNIGGQFLTFNIRGVSQSDFADLHESPNAVYIDQVYLSLMQANKFGLFDSERVEILKGPQGTLYGRNATGGLVHYITRKPTDAFEGYADLTYGSFSQTRFEGALSGPLGENVRARVALLYDRHDEIFENQVAGAEDEWGESAIGGRAHLQWDLSANVELLLTGFAGESETSTAPWQPFPTVAVIDADGNIVDTLRAGPNETRAGIGPGGADFCPVCLFIGPRPVPGADAFGFQDADLEDRRIYKDYTDDDTAQYGMHGGTAELTWQRGKMTLTSLTDYRTMEKSGVRVDVDSSPNDVLNFRADAENDQFSQEFRLMSGSEKTRWLAGAYYLTYDLDATQGAFGLNPATNRTGFIGGLQFVSPATVETESYSLFGQVEHELSPTLRLTTGLRVIEEQKDFTHKAQILALDGTVLVPDLQGFPGVTLSNTQALRHDDTLWAGKAQLDWQPTDDVMVYGGVSRGVKGGGFNQQLGGIFAIDNFEYDSETLTAYEVGLKSSLLEDTTRLNASLYYYSYADFQAHAANNLLFFVINADATIKGVELEVATQPLSGLDMKLGFSYTDAQVKDVPLATGPLGSGQKRFVDVEPTFTPKVQAFALARYEWPAFAGTLAIQGDVNYRGSSFTNITNFASTKMDSYVLGNLRLSYQTSDQRWRTEIFVKNVSDELAEQLGFDMSSLFGGSIRSYLPPRTAGINIRYAWQ